MPKSRIRKKDDFTPPPAKQAASISLNSGRRWVAPLMLAMFLIGLAWIVIFYVTTGTCRSSRWGTGTSWWASASSPRGSSSPPNGSDQAVLTLVPRLSTELSTAGENSEDLWITSVVLTPV
ncbi:hypothetical protein SVIO_056930 [Streptomyces violaceusniger]|uniref:Uncharacterized protein n=1 Tax=Streptomyces violaceusniger TaxID=68280 RepID=A0A4D4L7T4_STRVO|nr:hypothetical protein SVIO_056930 [Streptomyces violaceusniger]